MGAKESKVEEGDEEFKKLEEEMVLREQEKYGKVDPFFYKYDENGEKMLRQEQFKKSVKAYIRANPESEDKMKVLLSHLDTTTEVLDLDDYRSLMMIFLEEEVNLETLVTVFKIFDKGSKGHLEVDEIQHTFSKLGVNLQQDEVFNLVKEADENGDGILDFEEFIKILVSK